MIDPSWPIVLRGTWLYADQVPCEVRIVQGDVIHGTCDYEDPPEIQSDRQCECFYVIYDAGSDSSPHVGAYLTLAEAVTAVEKLIGKTLRWIGT